MSHHLLAELVAIVIAASVIAYLSYRLRQLPIVGFLVAGVAIGPHALGLVRDMELIDAVAEIGVILLLFTLGIEFSLEKLARMKRVIIVAGGLQVAITIAVAALLGIALGWSAKVALFTGALLALSSTAIVLKILAGRGEQSTEKGNVAIGILIFQDLAVILLVLLIPALGGGGGSPLEITVAIAKAIALIVAVLVVARRLMPPLLEAVAKTCSPEIFILSIIAICLGITWLISLTGVSLSLGAFIAGLVVSESRFSHHALSEVLPLQILFSAAFFVSVGMLLDLNFVAAHALEIAAIVATILLLKIVTTMAGAVAAKLAFPSVIASALLLAQVGEFSFVLERAGRPFGLSPGGRGPEGTQYFIAATVVLMIFTPFLASIGERIERSKAAAPRRRGEEPPATDVGTDEPSFEPSGHVIIAGYGTSARYLARVLRDTGIPFVVLTLSPDGVTEVQKERDHVIAGDYAKRMILQHAGIERAKILVIPDDAPDRAMQVASVAKAINPAVHVIAGTRRLGDVEEVFDAGADEVVPEEIEGAVELFGRVLAEYEISAMAIDRYKADVRRDHYAAVTADSNEPVVVCDELDPSCLNRRRVTIAAGSPVEGTSIDELPAPLEASRVERNGADVTLDRSVHLHAGDVVTIEGPAEAFAASLTLFRATGDVEEQIGLTPDQRNSPECSHTDRARRFPRPEHVCPECVLAGDSWVQLRLCLICGQVGCCDSSKNRHASRHATAASHPIIRSMEPGETWAWCFEDETYL